MRTSSRSSAGRSRIVAPPPVAAESCKISEAPIDRLAELGSIAFGSLSEQRTAVVLSVLGDLVGQGAGADLFLSEAVAGGKPVAAVIAARTASDSASLLAIGAGSGTCQTDDGRLIASLLNHLHGRLSAAGVRFVQAMREPEAECPELASCGYERLATLEYLLATRRQPEAGRVQAPAPPPHRFMPYKDFFGGERPLDALAALVEATYVRSLDCPNIGQHRSAAAAVDSYCQSPAHDPHGWQVLADADGRAVGCLLTTPHQETSALEVAYMGLIPEARGRDYGSAIIRRAWLLADACGLPQLTLAVDRENRPAMELYRRHGFETLMCEAAWGLSLAETRQPMPTANPEESATRSLRLGAKLDG